MMIAKYDAALSFGVLDLSGSGTAFPDELFLNKADAGRMSVHVGIDKVPAAGGTSVVVTVQGKSGAGSYGTVAQSGTVTLADLNAKGVDIHLPQGLDKEYLKVTVAKTGTFTAGHIFAAIDVYQGV